ncbi:XRE family transcriptional regulator [Clostridium baratii]|uniref:XRE family transcriptional regulator n=1 Tax=Clostridium baratii TaxID=1561 RepID=UPI0028FE25C8|nr:XRE family transcriptional regulator [Clostridium baratii]MDU1053733.1 XRE family transcriptional regulator [Clostridium baratii]
MNEKSTSELLDILKDTKNIEEFEEYLNSIDTIKYTDFSKYILEKCAEKGIKKSKLIADADINRTYGYQILNGDKKPSRDKIIKLCISAKLNLEETERALALAKVGKLYAKNVRDSAIIFAINKGLNVLDTNKFLYNLAESFAFGDE